jgi:hypothetical protein
LATAIDHACELASAPSTSLAARDIAEDFSMDRTVDRLLSLYRELAPMAGKMRW